MFTSNKQNITLSKNYRRKATRNITILHYLKTTPKTHNFTTSAVSQLRNKLTTSNMFTDTMSPDGWHIFVLASLNGCAVQLCITHTMIITD